MIEFPAQPGAYLLCMRLERPCSLVVGRLGEIFFPAGDYFYAGSAQGPGGLHARLGRHIQGGPKLHWHIDHLRKKASLVAIAYALQTSSLPGEPRRLECLWSQSLADLPQARVVAPGFGSTDCRAGCSTHLVAFTGQISHMELIERLPGNSIHNPVHFYELNRVK